MTQETLGVKIIPISVKDGLISSFDTIGTQCFLPHNQTGHFVNNTCLARNVHTRQAKRGFFFCCNCLLVAKRGQSCALDTTRKRFGSLLASLHWRILITLMSGGWPRFNFI